MRKLILRIAALSVLSVASTSVHAFTIGTDASTPGYSAKDILIQNPIAPDGIYWIDPDLPGGDAAFQVFADMTTFGGGWTMANDASGSLGTLDEHGGAINILAVDQNAQLRFVGDGFDAFYTGKYYETLPSAGWTVISGDPSALFGASWAGSFSANDVFVRETITTSYPAAAVPLPATVWLLGSAIGLLGWVQRKATSTRGRTTVIR